MANKKFRKNRKSNLRGFKNSYWNTARRSETARQVAVQVRNYQNRDEYMGISGVEMVQKTESILLTDLFASIFTQNMLHDPTIKREAKDLLREMLKEYGSMNVLYSTNSIPEGAVRLVGSDVYLTKERMGMPLGKFLSYLKGADFISENDLLKALAEWINTTPDNVYEVYRIILLFLLSKMMEKNKERQEDWGIFRPADIIGTSAPVIIGSINHYNYYY